MENTNTPLTTNAEAQGVETYVLEKRKRQNRLIAIGVLVLLFAGVLGWFGYTNPQLFRAMITRTGVPAGAQALYIPSYDAGPGDEGLIALEAQQNAGQINSIQFTLKYSPQDALSFQDDAIVFDNDTLFKSAELKSVKADVPGQVTFSFFSATPIDTNAAAYPVTLVKFKTKINPNIAAGTEIKLSVEGVDIVVPDPVETYKTSTTLTSIAAGSITIKTQDVLKVLNAEATDPTHIIVHFSDYLKTFSIGDGAKYTFDPVLVVNNVERGDTKGYDQKTVVLTTNSQVPGQAYTLTVSGVIGNTENGLDPNYNQVLFYGSGQPGGVLSNFAITGAQATGYHQIVVTFTDPPVPASVNASEFTVEDFNSPVPALTVADATASGNAVTLDVANANMLLKKNAYRVYVANPATNGPARADGAKLGVNEAVFTGFDNGPKIASANVVPDGANYALQITFDKNVVASNPYIGNVVVTGQVTNFLALNDPALYTLQGSTLRVPNFVSDANTNYTFIPNNNLTSADGLNVDPAYYTASFWGASHPATNTIGAATVLSKNSFSIGTGSLDFSKVTASNLKVFSYNSFNNLTSAGVLNVSKASDGTPQVVMTNNLSAELHYIVQITDSASPPATLAVTEFVVGHDFNIVSAEPIEPNKVKVTFSENIDQATVNAGAFAIVGNPALTVIPPIPPDQMVDPAAYNKVTLTLSGNTVDGNVYAVKAATTLRSYSGGKPIAVNGIPFAGYRTAAAQSTVTVNSAEAVSSTQVRLKFSDDVDSSTVTVLNVGMKSLGATPDTLTLSDVIKDDDHTYSFTTSKQKPNVNYFVTVNGVKDKSGLLVGNAKVVNFLGFTVPASGVATVTPSVMTNEVDKNVVLAGSNLNTIQHVRVGTTEVKIVDQPADGLSLTLLIPAGFDAGSYDLTLVNQLGDTQVMKTALLVGVPTTPMRVISEESKATPYRVLNDGVMKTKLWVLVEDPKNLNNISSVTVDLGDIGGPRSQPMQKDTGVQPQYRQWYTYETTVATTAATKEDPYLLPVEVRNGTEVVKGTISIIVTKNVITGNAPTVDAVYVSPMSVPPDGETPVKVSAQVTDLDGVSNITSVTADLGSLGVGFVPLKSADTAATGTQLTYVSDEFKIPTSTPVGTYPITVTAVAGSLIGKATLNLEVSNKLTGPSITEAFLAPRSSVPHDGKTTFTLNATVSHPEGLGKITSVMAYLSALHLPTVELLKGSSVSADSKLGPYASGPITIPSVVPIGDYNIQIIATDKSGSANSIVAIEVTNQDTLGEPPRVLSDKNYTTPRVAINDGTTPVTLYAFVADTDSNVQTVLVNLSSVGQVGPELPSDFTPVAPTPGTDTGTAASAPATGTTPAASASSTSSSSGACSTSSKTLVCMQPSVTEGSDGQWFVLPDVTISKLTQPSSEPYKVEVIATDATGKTSRGYIPVYVNNGAAFTTDRNPPQALSAVATSSTTVEVLFDKELSANSIKTDGSGFSIVNRNDVNQKLGIVGATINATGTVVTLTTEEQVSGTDYMLVATQDIQSSVGVPLVAGAANRVPLTGFVASDNPPVVDYIASTDVDTIEVDFEENLKPTSLLLAPVTGEQQRLAQHPPSGPGYNVEIYESGATSAPLEVKSIAFGDAANILIIKTATQKANQRYRVQMRDLVSYSGVSTPTAITKLVKGFNLPAVEQKVLANGADLNGDGKVDFTDFTMFSAVYGQTVGQPQQSNPAPATPPTPPTGQPITPTPDSTVPHTSVPAGGEIVPTPSLPVTTPPSPSPEVPPASSPATP